MDILTWITNWFTSNCDGDWEHDHQIQIYTLDNPGWKVIIDLSGTPVESLNIEPSLIENSAADWYVYSIKNSTFDATGDPQKLQFLLEQFKLIVEKSI